MSFVAICDDCKEYMYYADQGKDLKNYHVITIDADITMHLCDDCFERFCKKLGYVPEIDPEEDDAGNRYYRRCSYRRYQKWRQSIE